MSEKTKGTVEKCEKGIVFKRHIEIIDDEDKKVEYHIGYDDSIMPAMILSSKHLKSLFKQIVNRLDAGDVLHLIAEAHNDFHEKQERNMDEVLKDVGEFIDYITKSIPIRKA